MRAWIDAKLKVPDSTDDVAVKVTGINDYDSHYTDDIAVGWYDPSLHKWNVYTFEDTTPTVSAWRYQDNSPSECDDQKATVSFDMPKSCKVCPLMMLEPWDTDDFIYDCYCAYMKRFCDYESCAGDTRSPWCPL
ncbi:MAG: hypothetical protein LUC88_04750 [Prevotella sp.]|nr:hypothetical protein [Prevotella sp.]